jgi:hypothetical protein
MHRPNGADRGLITFLTKETYFRDRQIRRRCDRLWQGVLGNLAPEYAGKDKEKDDQPT